MTIDNPSWKKKHWDTHWREQFPDWPHDADDPNAVVSETGVVSLTVTMDHFRQSNLIEDVHDEAELRKSVSCWIYLAGLPSLTADAIQHAHAILMAGLLPPEVTGRWRRHNVRVGIWHAPAYYEVPGMMAQWVENSSRVGYGPYLLTPRQMHIRFEKIHPFIDGNGRIGRMLMWYHEMRSGTQGSLIKFDDRFDYYRWFEEP